MSLKLSLILSVDINNIIGYIGSDQQLSLPHIREDRIQFKNITSNAPFFSKNLLIVGRKTFFTLPESVQSCPNRTYVVLTTNPNTYTHPNAIFFSKFDDIISFCINNQFNKFNKYFVIGGATLYDLAIQTPFVTEIFLTKLNSDI